jgi:putative transposase
VIGLFKTEVIRRRGPWRSIDDVEFAVLEWVDWFNHRRLLEPIGMIPPAEHEAAYYRQTLPTEALPVRPESLR